jgi:phosphatidylserine/phosphatidylglycerophosphate/cardiolipin synthase-like enzyme
MDPRTWLITRHERDNPATRVDDEHGSQEAWSEGNLVEPLIHGAEYFAALSAAVREMRAGDLLLFTDWRGDGDETVDDDGATVGGLLCSAARRGVQVRGLIWRSHVDRMRFSEKENRHLSQEVQAAGGRCLLDTRVRPGGSHHQKFVVLRHPGRPEADVAFIGGIDLSHGRRDDAGHEGDPQAVLIADVYGKRPPWHDAQAMVHGPAVADAERVFRERWEDPAPVTRNPVHRARALLSREETRETPLPAPLPPPEPCGPHSVELLRTYPKRAAGYPFAPQGERSIARSYFKVLRQARKLIYVEDQYLWSREVAAPFAEALADNPGLHMIAVVPHHPAEEGRVARSAMVAGRNQVLDMLRASGGDRFAVYGIENHAGTPVYVHAKITVIDDVWAAIGSDNLNLRSWSHDSELSCAVLDRTRDLREPQDVGRPGDFPRRLARDLRLRLAREHLDRADGDDADLWDPESAFQAFAKAAAELQDWHSSARATPRPPGRIRPYQAAPQSRITKLWATPIYRTFFDPDGRPRALRRDGSF